MEYQELMLTVEEFAMLAGRQKETVQGWCASGKIESKIVSGHRLIPVSELGRVASRTL